LRLRIPLGTRPRTRLPVRLLSLLTVSSLLVVFTPVAADADAIRNREWIVSALDLAKAHHYSEGSGVVVAVIDSGVDPTHADLAGNVLSGADVSSDGKVSGNGHQDSLGHGTGIAGIVAGHGHGPGHADGVLGIAPKAKILPVKDGESFGFGIAPAITWAISHKAKVICIAQGDLLSGSPPDLEAAVKAAEKADIVVVAGAGNEPLSTSVAYPAAYPGVVAAAGTDEHGNHAAVSVTGPQLVLAAPATDVVQPYPNHKYSVGTGTSLSTAIIAGAAALIRSRYPKLSATEVVHRLTATATDKGAPGRDDEYGYGLVNIMAALTANVPQATPSASAGASTTTPRVAATTTATRTPTPTIADAQSSTRPPIGIIAAVAAVLTVLAIWLVARRRRTS
jgi:type VII secretion-associated serine protease mycosin